MNLSYGQAKTGGAGASDWAFGTDLGIATDAEVSFDTYANKGMIKTTEASDGSDNQRGSGYTLGTRQMASNVDNVSDVIGQATCSATGGTGTGAVFQIQTVYSRGVMVINTSLLLKNDVHNLSTTAKLTATGAPLTESTTPITGTQAGGNGAGATYQVNFVRGNITSVTVVTGGTGYISGTTAGTAITLAKADIEAGLGAGKVVSNDIIVFPLQGDVSGGIGSVINVTNGGSKYTVGDVLTLQEIGSSDIGDGKVVVATLSGGMVTGAAPNSRYPRGVKISTGTQAAPKTIEFVGMDDVNVIIGGFIAGTVFPFQFKQIIDAGTDAILGNITILY